MFLLFKGPLKKSFVLDFSAVFFNHNIERNKHSFIGRLSNNMLYNSNPHLLHWPHSKLASANVIHSGFQGWEGYFGNVIGYRLLVTLFVM